MGLLFPGLTRPVLTIRGVLSPAGLASMAPALLDKSIGDAAAGQLESMLNPTVTALVKLTGGSVKKVRRSRD